MIPSQNVIFIAVINNETIGITISHNPMNLRARLLIVSPPYYLNDDIIPIINAICSTINNSAKTTKAMISITLSLLTFIFSLL